MEVSTTKQKPNKLEAELSICGDLLSRSFIAAINKQIMWQWY